MKESIYYGDAVVEVSKINNVGKNVGVQRSFTAEKLVMKGNNLIAIRQNKRLIEKLEREYGKTKTEVFSIKSIIIDRYLGDSVN